MSYTLGARVSIYSSRIVCTRPQIYNSVHNDHNEDHTVNKVK